MPPVLALAAVGVAGFLAYRWLKAEGDRARRMREEAEAEVATVDVPTLERDPVSGVFRPPGRVRQGNRLKITRVEG